MRSVELQTELVTHLDAEVACLADLEGCLLDEQQALRRLEVENLLAIAARKTAIVTHQAFLGSARAALLARGDSDGAASCLSAWVRAASPDAREAIEARRERLAELVRRVQRLQAMNEAYAETGRQTVERALARLVRRRAGADTTYGSDGRVHAHDGRRVVREQG